jgi:hypothetical protein
MALNHLVLLWISAIYSVPYMGTLSFSGFAVPQRPLTEHKIRAVPLF